MKTPRGMSLIDVVVGVALILIVFLALLGLLRASLLISSSSKAKAGATAVATTHIEYLRSLPYDSVGTVGGIPAGPVAQYATTTLNGIPYGVRTFIQYVDDSKDGTGASDSNGITTDYKRVRVTATYTFRQEEREVAVVSNIAPPSIESTTGGGTLRINTVNALGAPVPGAGVRIQNSTVSPAIDFTTFADLTGAVLLPGAPASPNYRITVSKDGYSTAETYVRDATNQNPTPGYLTVAQNQTTSSTFSIDVLAQLVIHTFSPIRASSTVDTFANSSLVQEMLSTQVSAGNLILSGAPLSYALSGTARSVSFAPAYLSAWTSVTASAVVPSGTSLSVSITDGTGALLPDSVLPGNASGFSTFPINLSAVSTTTYPALQVRAQLSSDGISTPTIASWTLAYDEGPVPLPNVPFTLTGVKKKGTTGAGVPIPKTIVSTTTSALGTRTLSLEWDVYELAIPGYTIVTASSAPPYTIAPGTITESTLILQ